MAHLRQSFQETHGAPLNFERPAAAALSGIAYRYSDEYVPGQLMNKAKAQSIYTAITRRNRDPGIMEQWSPTECHCPIFPLKQGQSLRVRLWTVGTVGPNGARRPWTAYVGAADGVPVFGGLGGWTERGRPERYPPELKDDVVTAVAARGGTRWIGTQKSGCSGSTGRSSAAGTGQRAQGHLGHRPSENPARSDRRHGPARSLPPRG